MEQIMYKKAKAELPVEIGIFVNDCKDIAKKNWCESQVEMLDTLFEAARMGWEYKCVKCGYFGRPADAPDTVDKDCLWSMCKEEGESDIPPCEEDELIYPEHCGEDADCSECEHERADGGCDITDGKEMSHLGISIENLREELSRGCEYAGTQDVVHQSFYEAMEELGGIGDWDEMATEDLEGQMYVLQSLFEIFYDKTVEKILNYIESYKEEEEWTR